MAVEFKVLRGIYIIRIMKKVNFDCITKALHVVVSNFFPASTRGNPQLKCILEYFGLIPASREKSGT